MRIPSLQSLTEEQRLVYFHATHDRHVLVEGPPGTGKTVMASYRTQRLLEMGRPVTFGMFNRVLQRFSQNVEGGKTLPSETFISWFRQWWMSSGLPPIDSELPIVVDCPYEQKDEAKAAGAKWNPQVWGLKRNKPGAWTTTFDNWAKHKEVYARWKLYQPPPNLVGKEFSIDWKGALTHLLAHMDDVRDESLDIGTFLLDEGQDFPPDMYNLLRTVSSMAASRKRPAEKSPRCFVLADENQRLTSSNSTITQIRNALKIQQGDDYKLYDNFRNTLQIAEFARHYYADVGHLPKLPKRQGEIPKYALAKNLGSMTEFLSRWVRNNPKKETGVICFSNDTRKKVYDELLQCNWNARNRNILVQSYSSKQEDGCKAEDLQFDRPDTVTVLNVQSCKGLEFDCVFLVKLDEGYSSGMGEDGIKMSMFVAASRARDELFLIDIDPMPKSSPHLALLPEEEKLKRISLGTPTAQGSAPPAKPPTTIAAARSEDWEKSAIAFAEKRGLKYEDKRSKGGCFWVHTDEAGERELKALGFTYTPRKTAWWHQ